MKKIEMQYVLVRTLSHDIIVTKTFKGNLCGNFFSEPLKKMASTKHFQNGHAV